MTEYCLYGAQVCSEFPLIDRQLEGVEMTPLATQKIVLRELSDDPAPHHFPQEPVVSLSHGRELALHTDLELGMSTPGQQWCFEVSDTVKFTWCGGQAEVFFQLQDKAATETLAFWIVHIFLPLYLTLERGYNFLHAAVVNFEDSAVLFIAPSHGGKSTLADHFLKQGHPLLSDDKVAICMSEGRYLAIPSYPYHRPFREFETLGHPVSQFASSATPIKAFYLLGKGEPESALEITPVSGLRKFENLMPAYLYNFQFLRLQRLQWLAGFAEKSLIFDVQRPWSMQRMHEVYTAICEHCHALGPVPE
jgi:hypothetical protein